MANTSKEATRITYRRLNKVLATLGFVRKETKDFTAYREVQHDALIVLPNMSAESDVGDPHLVTVRNTVTGKGIASSNKLEALLVSLPIKPAASKLKLRASGRHSAYVKPRKPASKVHSKQPAQVEKAPRKPGIKKPSSPASA